MPWSPSPPPPRSASLQTHPSLCLNPHPLHPLTGTYGYIWFILIWPWPYCRAEPWGRTTFPMGICSLWCLCFSALLQIYPQMETEVRRCLTGPSEKRSSILVSGLSLHCQKGDGDFILIEYHKNRGPLLHVYTHLQLQQSNRHHKKSGRMSSRK